MDINRADYKYNFGQTISTDIPGYGVDRGFIANLSWTAAQAVAADTNGIFDGIVAPDGTAGHVKAADIVVTGKNMAGETITESFKPTVDTPATLTGAKAFKEITSVVVPPQDGDSVTVDVGFGELIGLPYKIAKKRVLMTLNDGVLDTAPTLAISATVLESNTVDFNGSLDGSAMDMSIIV